MTAVLLSAPTVRRRMAGRTFRQWQAEVDARRARKKGTTA